MVAVYRWNSNVCQQYTRGTQWCSMTSLPHLLPHFGLHGVHRSWYPTFGVHNLFLWGGASPTFGRTMVLLFSNNGNSKMLGHPTAGSMDNRGRDAFRENNGMVTKYREQWLYCSRTMEIPKCSNGGWGRPWKPQRITDGVTLTLAYCY